MENNELLNQEQQQNLAEEKEQIPTVVEGHPVDLLMEQIMFGQYDEPLPVEVEAAVDLIFGIMFDEVPHTAVSEIKSEVLEEKSNYLTALANALITFVSVERNEVINSQNNKAVADLISLAESEDSEEEFKSKLTQCLVDVQQQWSQSE